MESLKAISNLPEIIVRREINEVVAHTARDKGADARGDSIVAGSTSGKSSLDSIMDEDSQVVWGKRRDELEESVFGSAAKGSAKEFKRRKRGGKKDGRCNATESAGEQAGGIEAEEFEAANGRIISGDVMVVVQVRGAAESEHAEIEIEKGLSKRSWLFPGKPELGFIKESLDWLGNFRGERLADESAVSIGPSLFFFKGVQAGGDFANRAGARREIELEFFLYGVELGKFEVSREHFPGAVQEVVGFIDQQGVVAAFVFGEKALEGS